MKHFFIRIVLLVMGIAISGSMVGCNRKETEIDAQFMLESLLTEVTYETELEQVGSNADMYFLDLPQNSTIQLYTGSGYFADEVALLTLPSNSDCTEAMEIVQNHIKELRDQFMFYVPEELDKINHAVTYQNGRYIFLCITNDYVNAQRILNSTEYFTDAVPETPKQKKTETPDKEPEIYDEEKEADDLIFANNLSMIRRRLLIGKLANTIG